MFAAFAYYLHRLDPFIFSFRADFDFLFIHVHNQVGPRWYGLAYVLAFACGYWLLLVLTRRGYCDIPLNKVGDFITACALVGVIVGGRIGYVLFYKPEMLSDPGSIFRVWEGGMSSHGGMAGVLAVTFYFARRHRFPWTNLGDNLVVSAPIGLFFGRCANFINGELYGRAVSAWYAVQFPKELFDSPMETQRAIAAVSAIDPSLTSADTIVAAAQKNPQIADALRPILTPRHPSQLYEAFCEGVLLFLILWFARTRTRQPNGVLTGLFFICYAVFRIIVEYFREPDAALIAGFTRGQFFSFFLIVIGFAFVVYARKHPTFPKRMPK